MKKLTETNQYAEILDSFAWPRLWELFDGGKSDLNLAHECIDRHTGRGEAVSIMFADGHSEHYTFAEIAVTSSQVAHWFVSQGVRKGDRIAIMLEPGIAFYAAMFGAIKCGAIAVPMFTLFGPDALALRINDCHPVMLVTEKDTEQLAADFPELKIVSPDHHFWQTMRDYPGHYTVNTKADDLAVFQYTSGTTRALPEAVKHTHRAIVTLMIAALYGVGLRPGDRYFCPSSPAWGHGLWHGTFAPLALGIHIASYAGPFKAERMFQALDEFNIDNMAAAPTVYRMMKNTGSARQYSISLKKASFTGEPMDSGTAEFIRTDLGAEPCSMYGSTEVGVIIVNYPGVSDYVVRPGALGKAAPGWIVAIVDDKGNRLPLGETGEIAVKKKGGWFCVKDRGYQDEDGYFFHGGRSDDVIISAGWTMSAIEIEDTLMKHDNVVEAVVIGVPDDTRGQVVKAFIVCRDPHATAETDIQQYMKSQLSAHEYPRIIEFVTSLPKTPAGKINRKALKERVPQPTTEEAS